VYTVVYIKSSMHWLYIFVHNCLIMTKYHYFQNKLSVMKHRKQQIVLLREDCHQLKSIASVCKTVYVKSSIHWLIYFFFTTVL
jgi:hypothetical protein